MKRFIPCLLTGLTTYPSLLGSEPGINDIELPYQDQEVKIQGELHPQKTLEVPYSAVAIDWHPDQQILYYACTAIQQGQQHQSTINRFDLNTQHTTTQSVVAIKNRIKPLFNLNDDIASLKVSPDGNRIAVGHWGGHITIRNSTSLSKLSTLRAQEDASERVRFSSSESTSSNDDSPLRHLLPELSTPSTPESRQEVSKNIACLVWKDNLVLISGSWDGSIRFWNAENSTCRTTITTDFDRVRALGLTQDKQTLAAGCSSGTVYIIDAQDEKQTSKIDPPFMTPLKAVSLDWNPTDINLLLVAYFGTQNAGGQLKLFKDKDCIRTHIDNQERTIRHTCWNPNGSRIYAAKGEEDGTLSMHTQTLDTLKEIPAHQKRILALAIQPSTRLLATGSDADGQTRGEVKIWGPELPARSREEQSSGIAPPAEDTEPLLAERSRCARFWRWCRRCWRN